MFVQRALGSTIVQFSVSGEPVLVPPPLQERIRVREFIEDLISSMLGGSLDDVCVGQIYENIDCEYCRRRCLHSRRFSILFFASRRFKQVFAYFCQYIFTRYEHPLEFLDIKLFARFHTDLSKILLKLEIALHQSLSGESCGALRFNGVRDYEFLVDGFTWILTALCTDDCLVFLLGLIHH